MKKHFLLITALLVFGSAPAQDKAPKIIAEVLPPNEVTIEKTEKTEKKSKKERAEKKAKKADRKKTAATTPKRYYIDSSGQKKYVE